MSKFLDIWNTAYEALPADTEQESLGAGRIRNLKTDISGRMKQDHSWAGDDSDGYHEAVTLLTQSSDPTPTPASGTAGSVYSKVVSGNNELFYKDSSSNVIQLTQGGVLNPSLLNRSIFNIAAAATTDLSTSTSNIVNVNSGSANITSWGSPATGAWYLVRFGSVGPIVIKNNGATGNLNNADITVNQNDWCILVSQGGGNFVMAVYQRYNGTPLAGQPFTNKFTSSQQAISQSATISVAHGLGAAPFLYFGVLHCVTADNGYSPGDEVQISGSSIDAGTVYSGIALYIANGDTANIKAIVASGQIDMPNKSSGQVTGITMSKWALIIKAWL